LINESNTFLTEMEAGLMQRILAKCMLRWW